MVLTGLFLPDTTGLDLREQVRFHLQHSLLRLIADSVLPQERYWRCVRAGHPELYHGIAIHPRHLSWYERTVLKRNRHYDPVQDRLDRIEELRVLYESYLIAHENPSGDDDPEHAYITDDVINYFRNETPEKQRIEQQIAKEDALAGHGEKHDVMHRSRLEESMGRGA